MTDNTFSIHQSTVPKVILEVCQSITKYLGSKFLCLHKIEEEIKENGFKFEVKFSMPQAFGAINGAHIPIQSPTENSQNYFNYNGFFVTLMQSVCEF